MNSVVLKYLVFPQTLNRRPCQSVTQWVKFLILGSSEHCRAVIDNDYNEYNEYNDYNDYNDCNDHNGYNDYNDYRDSDLDFDSDLDWELQ